MTTMAALATLTAPAPFQLASDAQLRRSLARYKHPLRGLNTNKLSLSTSKSSPHQALLTQLHNNEQELQEILNLNLPIHSAVIDSGASFTSINNKALVAKGTMVRLEQPIMLDGIAGGITVEYKCDIKFECIDKDGNAFPCQTEAYYHDQLPCMLLSPQAFLSTQHLQKLGQRDVQSLIEDHFTIYRNRVECHAERKHLLTVPYDQSFLPRMQLFPSGQAGSTLKAFHTSVLHESNKNLTPLQKVWLKLHHRLGHPSFSLIQQMASGGYFNTQALGLSQLKLTDAPMCEACKYGKQVC
jgi:GAG-pre-integrase domain